MINIRRIITLNLTIWKNWCKIVPIGWSSLQSRLSYGRKSIHTITVIQFPNISNFINFCVLYWKKSSLQFMFPTCSAILAIIVYLHHIHKFYLKFFFIIRITDTACTTEHEMYAVKRLNAIKRLESTN